MTNPTDDPEVPLLSRDEETLRKSSMKSITLGPNYRFVLINYHRILGLQSVYLGITIYVCKLDIVLRIY